VGPGRWRRSTRNMVLLHFIEGFGGERFRVNVQGVASLLGLGPDYLCTITPGHAPMLAISQEASILT